MATQTGSIDLKAAKKAHDDASMKATNYLADLSNGVLVHPEDDLKNGVQITDVVDIMREIDGVSTSVAEFGEEARIGLLNDAEKVVIGNGGISMYTADNAEYFKAFVDDVNVKIIQIEYNLNPPITSENSGTGAFNIPSQSIGITEMISASDWNAVSNGNKFSIMISCGEWGPYIERYTCSFTKGINGSLTKTYTRDLGWFGIRTITCTVDYDSSNDTISFSGQATDTGYVPTTWPAVISLNGIIYPKQVPNPKVQINGGLIVTDLVGEIKQYAGATVPQGWHLCDGSELLKEDYPLLYEAIGDLWGTASDSDHFKIPDFSGRVPVGFNSADTIFDTVGKTGGSKNAIVPYHNHNLGSTKYGSNYCASGNRSGVGQNSAATTTINTSYAGSSGNATNANLQPYAVVKYIICTA